MAQTRYRKGTTFEYVIRDKLHPYGYAVARGAGSKGSSKADLVAFSPHGAILIIQAKTNGIISAEEWNRLWDISQWSAKTVPVAYRIGVEEVEIKDIPVRPVIPIIAYKNPRGSLLMDEIVGPRVRMKPHENRKPFEWRCQCSPPHENLNPKK